MKLKILIIVVVVVIFASSYFILKLKKPTSQICPLIAPACPLENCLKAGKELEAKYPGCDYTSNCEKRCQIEECGPQPGAPGKWVCENGKWVNKEESRLQLLLKNTGFEEVIPDKGDNGKTFDPAIWDVVEGKTEKGTANVIEEWPGLIQVVSKENGVLPYEGNKMLKIDARLYVKTNIRQFYSQPISEGKLVQEIFLYPFSNEYLQQIEIRGTRDKGRTGYKKGEEEGIRGNQLLSLKYSHLGMLLVVTTGKETKNGRHIIWKELPALPQNQWSKIKIVLEKVEPGRDEIGEFSQFKLSLYLNDKLLYQSGRPNEPYVQFFSSADFVVIGDDYVLPEGKSQDKDKIMGPTTGDSFGIIYYDLANAWRE